jgi:hypothetical protein
VRASVPVPRGARAADGRAGPPDLAPPTPDPRPRRETTRRGSRTPTPTRPSPDPTPDLRHPTSDSCPWTLDPRPQAFPSRPGSDTYGCSRVRPAWGSATLRCDDDVCSGKSLNRIQKKGGRAVWQVTQWTCRVLQDPEVSPSDEALLHDGSISGYVEGSALDCRARSASRHSSFFVFARISMAFMCNMQACVGQAVEQESGVRGRPLHDVGRSGE